MAGKPTGIKIIKENFENALKMAGISKIKLAAASGVPLRLLQRNINTTGRINHENLIALCEVLDADPRYIIESDFQEYKKWCTAEKLSRNPFTGEPVPEWMEENKKRIDPNGIYIQQFRDYSSEHDLTNYVKKLYEALYAHLMRFEFFRLRSDKDKSEIINELFDFTLIEINKKTDDLSVLWSLDDENEDS